MKQSVSAHRLPALPVLAIAVSTLLVFAGAFWFAREQVTSVKTLTESELRAVAGSKVERIVQWRSGQEAGGAELSSNSHFVEAVVEWFASRDVRTESIILSRFRSRAEHYGYTDVLLLDATGRTRLSLHGAWEGFDAESLHAIGTAFTEGRSVLTDLHVNPAGEFPHLSVVAPLVDHDGSVVGGLVFVNDARSFLFPLLESKPMAGETVETLLVRREGDDALILNDLRYSGEAKANPRIPPSQIDSPAVMAIRGVEGFVTGTDHRGVKVFSVIHPVPGSSWFILVKIDTAEALGVLTSQGWLLVALLTIALLLAFIAMAAIRQRHLKVLFRTRFEVESARRAVVERYGVILRSIGDAVIVTDAQGRIELMNPVAESVTGWPETEAVGMPMHDIFRIFHESTRLPMENPVETVMREGSIVALGNHTVLVTRDGKEVPIADAGAPVRDEEGRMSGVVLVFRDQTAAHAAIRALKESERRFRRIYEQSPVAYHSLDGEGRIVEVNPAWRSLLGYSEEEILGTGFLGYLSQDSRTAFTTVFESCSVSGVCHAGELELRAKDGTTVIASLDGVRVDDPSGGLPHAHCVLHNITERKLAERRARDAMTRLEASRSALLNVVEDHRAAGVKLAEQVDELQRWHDATSGRENRILELKLQVNELLLQAGKPARYPSVESDMDEDILP